MLITLEGLDGSGKTTAWRALKNELAADVTFTREPTDTWYGEAVERSLADGDADPLAELFLYTADHAAHLSHTVRPALERGDVVIADRYSDSRYAYQGATLDGVLDSPMTYVQAIHEPFTLPPDVTLYFDLDPETAAERSGKTNKFEERTYLAQVRQNYERLITADHNRFIRIDAAQSESAVLSEVQQTIERLIG